MKSGIFCLFVCLLLAACTTSTIGQSSHIPVTSVAPTYEMPTGAAPTNSVSIEPSRAPLPTSTLPEQIAFTSDRDSDKNIYVMNTDGTDQRGLTDDAAWDWSPAWSLDGRLAFYSSRDGNIEVYVMNGDGSDQHNVSQHPDMDAWHSDHSPSWSPDGRLAFYSNREHGYYDIYVAEADGSSLQKLGSGMSPVWSSDGRSVIFACADNGTLWEICMMDADGSNRRILTTMNLDHNQWWKQFSLSPDGRSIALSYKGFQSGDFEIFIMDVDGSNRRNLTQNLARDEHPTWSPDGRSIAFASDRDGNWEIYVMDADGSNQRNLTQHPADDTTPAWSQ